MQCRHVPQWLLEPMVEASMRRVLFAAIAGGVVGALGEGAPDPSHLITSRHIGHATVLGKTIHGRTGLLC